MAKPATKLTRRFLLLGVALAGAGFGIYTVGFRKPHIPQPAAKSETLFSGIDYERIVQTTPRPLVSHVVRVDLRTPGLRFLVTPPDRKDKLPLTARLTSEFLSQVQGQLAINGDFFYPFRARNRWDYYPYKGDPVTLEGRACSNGNWYINTKDRSGFPSLYLTRDNRAHIGLSPPKGFTPFNVVSGNAILLEHGRIHTIKSGELQPRTIVALDDTGRFLWFVVVDGRQKGYSEGATLEEVVQLLQKRGATSILNLDGGGSATLAVRRGSEPEVLNQPIHVGIPGRERPVANHLAVFVP